MHWKIGPWLQELGPYAVGVAVGVARERLGEGVGAEYNLGLYSAHMG